MSNSAREATGVEERCTEGRTSAARAGPARSFGSSERNPTEIPLVIQCRRKDTATTREDWLPMTADWASLEGRMINGVYPLLRLLGSAERSAVFLSRSVTDPPSDIAVKLVPAIPGRAELLLPRWRSATALDHPHLLRLFEAGECEVGGQRYLYLVMEYAEQNLAQLLEHRALAPEEVRGMLGPTLDALEFLHDSKRVHGGLKPSNVMVVGEQIKLASDAVGPASDVVNDDGASGAALSPYQPPEAGSGVRSAAGDVWAVGVMTCEALSRRRPAGLHAIGGSIALPSDIPPTFREMDLEVPEPQARGPTGCCETSGLAERRGAGADAGAPTGSWRHERRASGEVFHVDSPGHPRGAHASGRDHRAGRAESALAPDALTHYGRRARRDRGSGDLRFHVWRNAIASGE